MAEKKRKVKKRPTKKSAKKKKDTTRAAVFTLVSFLAVLVIAVSLLYTRYKLDYRLSPPVKPPKAASKKPPEKVTKKRKPPRKAVIPKKTKPHHTYKVAIVIDDLGYDNHLAEELLKIDAPLTFSIFPLCPCSKSVAQKAHALGRDVMLHLPMEPHGYPEKNPGIGSLFLNMSDEELLKRLDENIRSVPFIKGVNNHMGSRFTEDKEKMRVVLREIKRRKLFFLDSRTSKDSVVYSMAKEMGVGTAERKIFLDNNQDVDLINSQVYKLAKASMKNGSAIGICHPYPSTIKALKQIIPKLMAKGIEVVPVSQLVE